MMAEKRPAGSIDVFKEDEPRKLFVGGLTRNTNADTLRSYFGYFGNIVDSIVMTDQQGQSRGFGFVTFDNTDSVEYVLQQPVHFLDSKQVDVKRSVPKNMRPPPRQNDKGKKAFLGGLPTDISEDELKELLSIHGKVTDCTIMYDEKTMKSRGFGFVGFEDDTVIDNLLKQQHVQIRNKRVEVKPARPRTNPISGDPRMAQNIGPSMPYGVGAAGYGYGYQNAAAALVASNFLNFNTGNAAQNQYPPQKRPKADESSLVDAALTYANYGYGAYAPYPGTTGTGPTGSSAPGQSPYDPYASYYGQMAAPAQQQYSSGSGYMPQQHGYKPEANGSGAAAHYWPTQPMYGGAAPPDFYKNATNNSGY